MKEIQGSAFLSSGLETVNYNGTQAQWNSIEISKICNDALNNAKKNFLQSDIVGSVLSQGYIWLIAAVAVLALGAVAALIIEKKKKKTALAENSEE